jgi:hypothetical protein
MKARCLVAFLVSALGELGAFPQIAMKLLTPRAAHGYPFGDCGEYPPSKYGEGRT